ncbi:MAG TPA: polysaccharide lyase family protein [Terriglobales bacterium]|nr:polysaccharide lyase family protein [Terriglobales bacterium]
MRKTFAAISLLMSSFFTTTLVAQGTTEVFRIGQKNNTFTEFSRARSNDQRIHFVVGQSDPGKDWPSYQPGSFDTAVSRSTMQRDWTEVRPGPEPSPFEIEFRLSTPVDGTFTLHLDALFRYRRPAPPRYKVVVNGKPAASYRLNPHSTPELWWPNGGEADGNTQYFGYESIDMPLSSTLFRNGANTISVQCVDGFGIHYDSLSLSHSPVQPAVVASASVTPLALYKNRPSGLVELATVKVRTTRPLGKVHLITRVGSNTIDSQAIQEEAGDLETIVEVPATETAEQVSVHIAGQKKPAYQGIFTPVRKWHVYALSMEQADFGYNDLPARTLEWENRFIDKTLQIQSKYPSYSFNLDAAANLESYLATRDDPHGKQLLDYLQKGKWGINALYANFFTGLSTPEELYRTLDYSLQAGKKHGLKIDSASQTDEPSITWAMPQILEDAGISYFTNGSDPIRGAMNPIGLLNFKSPFYWESPTGSKVLMWSGISYTAVDDMTWGGWSAESAKTGQYATSIFGLTRSLPLFLTQYDRKDFPFDAVMLFGLHNDEIPMRHWGDADVIDMWNREYAYPKLIPATQRDFFTHITANFADKIATFRGDGGAYWEDEAGSDAHITSMIRTAQTRLTAAEKFESIANWLQPHLKFDRVPFDAAWKNILLADSYVWSDANSFRRPESYRTREGEAAHRAWAEAALQQTTDLRLVAMDKVAELVGSDKQGTVIFNPESWERSDLFDFELEPDEILMDPATNQPIPCGVIKAHRDYQDVRCWAANVPAMGYKFYAIAKGKTPAGEALTLTSSKPEVENKFYKIEIDSQTGAIAHLIDKTTGIDLVSSTSGYRLNEYLYVTGGDPGSFIPGNIKDSRILMDDVTLPLPKLDINRATATAPPQAWRFPWGLVITTRAKALNTPEVVSTITLLDSRKQINFHNEVEKTATLKKEGIYFAFPFSLKQPQMKYQGATAWVDPTTDMLPGANREWFTTQGGVWGKGSGNNVGWSSVDAPLITLEDINRGAWPSSIDIRTGSLFSYAMNNYWYTDTPAQQGGRFTFRYSLTSGPDVTEAQTMVMTSEQRSPFFAIRHYDMGWQPTLSDQGTAFLKASPEGINVLTIRPLEDDRYLVRIQNTTASPISARIELPKIKLQEAYLGTVTGEKKAEVEWTPDAVTVPLGRYEIKSLVVAVKNRDSSQ